MYGASLLCGIQLVELTETCPFKYLLRPHRLGEIGWDVYFRETYKQEAARSRSTFNLLCNYTMQRQNGSTQQGRAMGWEGVRGVITSERDKDGDIGKDYK